jgi:hypothetical protein
MTKLVSPLAPTSVPALPKIVGVKLAAAATGIRYKNRPDVLLALLDAGTKVAGCLTNSKSRSAPVDWCADNLKTGTGRECWQRQRFHRQGRRSHCKSSSQSHRQTFELQARRYLSSLNRCNRRAFKPGTNCKRIA